MSGATTICGAGRTDPEKRRGASHACDNCRGSDRDEAGPISGLLPITGSSPDPARLPIEVPEIERRRAVSTTTAMDRLRRIQIDILEDPMSSIRAHASAGSGDVHASLSPVCIRRTTKRATRHDSEEPAPSSAINRAWWSVISAIDDLVRSPSITLSELVEGELIRWSVTRPCGKL